MIRRVVKKARGFTLIELMITVAIVAILAAIAYPSYQNSIRKSRRTEAKTTLENVAAEQERYYYQNNIYTADLSQHGFTGAAGNGERPSENNFYSIKVIDASCGGATPWQCTSYSIQARPLNTQAVDLWIYMLSSDGAKRRCQKANTTNFTCQGGTTVAGWDEN